MRAIKSSFPKFRCCVFCHFCHLPINVNKTISIDFDKGRLKNFQTTFYSKFQIKTSSPSFPRRRESRT
ncbi:hypothetical protein [Neisseria sicca]|uniref:hypothetical protein n=1 Tax=Neisseria sicca TaxID=490 RepID=UPI0011BD0F4B|nr:hypothetical protein [Neisseria sicca]